MHELRERDAEQPEFKPWKDYWTKKDEDAVAKTQQHWYRMPDGYPLPNLDIKGWATLLSTQWQYKFADTHLTHYGNAWARPMEQDTAYNDVLVAAQSQIGRASCRERGCQDV